jgi:acetyltransferase-like isoleucine patch superfamily enzyme
MAAFAVLSRVPSHRLRVAFLRAAGADISPSAVVYHGFQVRDARELHIGARTNVGDHAILDARGGLTLGSDVNLSTGVEIWTAQHDWQSADFAYVKDGVSIGDHVWIGPRVIVLPGTRIGEGAVIAGGAVARGDLEPYALYGGVPARKLADRPGPMAYRLPGPGRKSWWW